MANFEQYKKRIYEVVEQSSANDYSSRAYDIMMVFAIIVGLIPLTIKNENKYCIAIDILTAVLFLIDYLARLYTADYKMGIKSYKSYLFYAVSPLAIVDLLSIVPVFTYIIPSAGFSEMFKLFRLFRLLIVIKLVRYSKTMITIGNVLRKIRRPLSAVFALVILYIIAAAMVMFQLEPDIFDNYFEAVYWASISVTSIGYGDIVPQTMVGQFFTIVSSLVGIALIALPTGIITAAYTDEVRKKKGKHEL